MKPTRYTLFVTIRVQPLVGLALLGSATFAIPFAGCGRVQTTTGENAALDASPDSESEGGLDAAGGLTDGATVEDVTIDRSLRDTGSDGADASVAESGGDAPVDAGSVDTGAAETGVDSGDAGLPPIPPFEPRWLAVGGDESVSAVKLDQTGAISDVIPLVSYAASPQRSGWAASGRYLAIVPRDEDGTPICVVDIEHPQSCTPLDARWSRIQWSPTGARLSACDSGLDACEILQYGDAGSFQVAFTIPQDPNGPNSGVLFGPRWTPQSDGLFWLGYGPFVEFKPSSFYSVTWYVYSQVNAAGMTAELITGDPGDLVFAGLPEVSPNGTYVVHAARDIHSPNQSHTRIEVMDRRERPPRWRPETALESCYHPRWIDDDWIALYCGSSEPELHFELVRRGVAGTQVVPGVVPAHVSPVSRKRRLLIAHGNCGGGPNQVCKVRVSTSGELEVTVLGSQAVDTSGLLLSPDERYVAYWGEQEVYIYDLEQAALRVVSAKPSYGRIDIEWSGDSRWLIVEDDDAVRAATGGAAVPMLSSGTPNWAPDGRAVASTTEYRVSVGAGFGAPIALPAVDGGIHWTLWERDAPGPQW